MARPIPFNRPHLNGKEVLYLQEVLASGHLSGDGPFTEKCQNFFRQRYGLKNNFLTTSCTDALELISLLLDLKPGDEVILPSFGFTSTANAFALRGAKLVFADSEPEHPNLDVRALPNLITSRTRAIVVIHYAGMACAMTELLTLAQEHSIMVVEDAAQAIDSFYQDRPLGSLGAFGAFSFHETKNIMAGEGGLLTINDEAYLKRAEILREKGTNRSAFTRGEIEKYNWVDLGSSFLPSELIAAVLYAQIEQMETIQSTRQAIWQRYHTGLNDLAKKGLCQLPVLPKYATNNAHIYYLVCRKAEERSHLLSYLRQRQIQAAFHYQTLHDTPYYASKHDGRALPQATRYSECLLRLPLHTGLEQAEIDFILQSVHDFYATL